MLLLNFTQADSNLTRLIEWRPNRPQHHCFLSIVFQMA